MKKILLVIALVAFTGLNAQTDVVLRINHFLGTNVFALDDITSNNLGNQFKVTRCEYYVSSLTLIHDGGTETAISTDTIALVNAADGPSTEIELGNLTFTTIEGIKFHVGVQAPENNEDPSLLPADHPLAPKSPSMHWGWTAGYRFAAFEGVSGADFAQSMQFHGLGNVNYFETTVMASSNTEGSTEVISISADYRQVVKDIDVSSGVISHGETGEALESLKNFQTDVFGTQVLNTEEKELINWSVYPNPSTDGNVIVYLGDNDEIDRVNVLDVKGAQVYTVAAQSGAQLTLPVLTAGTYIVNVIDENKVLDTKQLIVQ
ncbi:MAG: T9SS type A sorting domain-containing protein [Crocinitomicaceae bacterium]|nr:T9SS type A sorting domain-containing protein [Crocinitomicaceae bacterium]